jgi:hypothetical protein
MGIIGEEDVGNAVAVEVARPGDARCRSRRRRSAGRRPSTADCTKASTRGRDHELSDAVAVEVADDVHVLTP